jgi:hypothetical protein
LSLRAQLFRGVVIAPAVRGGGGCVGMGGINVQVRCVIVLVVGQLILQMPANAFALASGVSHTAIGNAEQSDTAIQTVFAECPTPRLPRVAQKPGWPRIGFGLCSGTISGAVYE